MSTAGHGKRVTALLVQVLGEQQGLGSAAGVHLSRSGLHRAFLRCFGESPAAFRRRLLLEQAAWTLSHTATSVTDLAFDCGFGSLEGFTRAFRRAYGVSPSLYRRGLYAVHDLSAPSGIHFRPALPGRSADSCHFLQGQSFIRVQEEHMDILEHLLGFDQRFMQRALTLACQLPEGALDRPLGQTQALDFEAPDRTLRDLLDKQVFTKEVWFSAVRGGVMPAEDRSRSLDGLLARLELAYPAFLNLA